MRPQLAVTIVAFVLCASATYALCVLCRDERSEVILPQHTEGMSDSSVQKDERRGDTGKLVAKDRQQRREETLSEGRGGDRGAVDAELSRKAAEPQSSFPREVVAPVTPQQREAFIATAVYTQQQTMAAHAYTDFLSDIRAQVVSSPDAVSRERVEQLIKAYADRQFESQAEKWMALSEFVRTQPDLSNNPGKNLKKGEVGTMELGVNDPDVWGPNTRIVRVSYYLEYDKWPRLGDAHARLKAARSELEPFLYKKPNQRENKPNSQPKQDASAVRPLVR